MTGFTASTFWHMQVGLEQVPHLLHFYPSTYLHKMTSRFSPTVELTICFFGTLLVTIPLAYATWRWVEEPGIGLGRKLTANLEGRRVAVGAIAGSTRRSILSYSGPMDNPVILALIGVLFLAWLLLFKRRNL
jgi:hypothetical protein